MGGSEGNMDVYTGMGNVDRAYTPPPFPIPPRNPRFPIGSGSPSVIHRMRTPPGGSWRLEEMRTFLALLVIVLLPASLGAQQERTLLDRRVEHGGFGGPAVKFTEIADHFGVLVGGRAGWIINHSLVLGGGGYGLANTYDFELIENGRERHLALGYGGLEVEYVNRWRDVAHLAAGILVGGGGASWYLRHRRDWGIEDINDAFFIAEPSLNLEMNVLRFFRVAIGGSYRFVEGLDMVGLGTADLRGAAGSLTLKFGEF